MLVTLALTPDDTQLYAALVGVAAVTAWFGGLGPAAVALVLGWTFQLLELVFVSDDFQGIEVTRWLATLGIGLAVVLASEALRRGREQASTRQRRPPKRRSATWLGYRSSRRHCSTR